MTDQAVFRRSELKYLITPAQRAALLDVMASHMIPDPHGPAAIRNIYFDTPDFRLIRRSLEKPVYKEKLRLRSYWQASPDTRVFAELKKKFDHVVYKRRLGLRESDAMAWLCGSIPCPADCQISREIDYCLAFYRTLRPSVFLSYDREAWYCSEDASFRVTFDTNALFRREHLSLEAGIGGTPLLPEGKVLMEIKCASGIPLWMAQALTRQRIYCASFSKYGQAYRTMILKGERTHV